MTYEDAKDMIKCALGCGCTQVCNAKYRGLCKDNDVLVALEIAIEALEKQIPKKVIDHDYCIAEYGDSGCQVGGIFCYKATCPTCNNTIANGEIEKSDLMDIYFCDRCGQMLDWSEEE